MYVLQYSFRLPTEGCQAELAWVAWLNTEMVYVPENGHPSQCYPGLTRSYFDVTTEPNCLVST